MSQHDFDIANQPASNARTDINNALKALASLSSGNTSPSTTYANMLWYETDTNTLKMRAEADDAWISIGYLNQSTDTFALFDDTKVVNSGGTQTGILGDQSTSVWESGSGTTESLVSPAKVKAAIESLVPEGVGVNQTWQDVESSRAVGTSYQNTTGVPIQVSVEGSKGNTVQVSENGSTWLTMGTLGSPLSWRSAYQFIVPASHYYRVTGGSGFDGTWLELR